MFGGYSFLVFLRDKLSPEQQTFFRAGHAHAGVLLILSLVYYHYLSLTIFSLETKYIACIILAIGIIFQSGGFFWHTFLDKDGKRTGIRITTIGALFLASAVIMLVVGIAEWQEHVAPNGSFESFADLNPELTLGAINRPLLRSCMVIGSSFPGAYAPGY